MTPYEVSKLLSAAQERINDILADCGELTSEDYATISEWQYDVESIFTAIVDEISWVAQGKPMLPSH